MTAPGIPSSGDGLTQTGTVAVPWAAFAHEHTLLYQLALVAFGRVVTDGAPGEVQYAADFANTARLTAVQVLDAAGNDITAQMELRFAHSTTSVVPEPSSVVLVASGALLLLPAARRRRRAR